MPDAASTSRYAMHIIKPDTTQTYSLMIIDPPPISTAMVIVPPGCEPFDKNRAEFREHALVDP